MTPSQAVKALDAAAETYWLEVYRVAAALRARYVVPFCDRTGARFDAGMGSYGFDDSKGKQLGGDWDNGEGLPSHVAAACDVRDAINGQSLGSLMDDYKPGVQS